MRLVDERIEGIICPRSVSFPCLFLPQPSMTNAPVTGPALRYMYRALGFRSLLG